MYLIAIAWIYVVLLMSIAEATNTTGTVLGALITFLLYGAVPLSLVLYLMRTPARRRAIKAKEKAEEVQPVKQFEENMASLNDSFLPDTSRHTPSAAPADRVAAVRKEP